MKLPLSWIKEVIDIDLPPHQIANKLTLLGLEVDSFTPMPLSFSHVIVGEVLQAEKHPEADKLTVATVSDGVEKYQVVCGAPNCRKGLKTAFALIGASLEDEGKTFKVKKTKLRGVESFGMLCSERELGLGENHEGIMEFSDQVKVGADVAELYGDTIFEISLTPNLGHCASVLGVARELSASTSQNYILPKHQVTEDSAPIASYASVAIENQQKCPRYACRVIRDVTIAPSPEWLQRRLIACDMRPVNNIVDITNYVLMELGHPLHAFDYDRLQGHQIIVRNARNQESFTTLDGKTHLLEPDDLLICDQARAIALAGIMGGQNTEVSAETKNILLEAAYFHPGSIRRSSKKLGIQTEASRRFEKGCDPNMIIQALDRAALLMQEIAGGKVSKGVIDLKAQEFPKKVIYCRLHRINQLLGTQLGLSEVESIFKRLEMPSEWDGKEAFKVTVPTYRVDVKEEVDLIEEVCRIYGFENIPKPLARYTTSTLNHAPIFIFEREVRSRLVAQGLQECLSCDLIGPTLLEIAKEAASPDENTVKVLNPTSVEQSILRTTLLPGLLQAAKYNNDRDCKNLHLFEIGRVHFKKDNNYFEHTAAGILLMGKSHPYHYEEKPEDSDFFHLKGIVENLFNGLGIKFFSLKNEQLPFAHPGRQATLTVEGRKVGTMGEVHPTILRRLDVSQKVLFAEIDLHELISLRFVERKMEEIPIFPGSDRDLTLNLHERIPIDDVLNAIHSVKSRLLENVSLIDIYRSEKIGHEQKNATFRFFYRDPKKTISQETVDAEHARITSQIESGLRR